ncbi:MAG: 50S ribosomal protein L10 [Candidatus Aminicenantales bacterium]
MKREVKEKLVRELEAEFSGRDSFYLFDYTGMTVAQSMELRKLLRKNDCAFKVVKNRLARRALREDFPAEIKSYFEKPTAIAFAAQDPIRLARLLRDFAHQNKVLTFKGGLIEGQLLPPERFEEVCNLASREELLGKIGYLMAYPLITFLRTWQAPLATLGRLLSQLKEKK